jgi:hypothetical protein
MRKGVKGRKLNSRGLFLSISFFHIQLKKIEMLFEMVLISSLK